MWALPAVQTGGCTGPTYSPQGPTCCRHSRGGIYGANSSGKSNLIKAMSTMRRLVLQSFEQSSAAELNITPFLLNTESEENPSLLKYCF